ncbi:hypothetical protein D3C80_1732430 [compost metagenome]
MATLVAKGVGGLDQHKRRRQQLFQGLAEQPQFTAVIAAHPQPQVVLGARIVDGGGQLREGTQAINATPQRLYQRRAETGHHTAAIYRLQQCIEHASEHSRCVQGEK